MSLDVRALPHRDRRRKRFSARRRNWAPLLASLRSKPGEWVAFEDAHISAAHDIRKGLAAGARPGEFETRAAESRCTLFVRYVGAQA